METLTYLNQSQSYEVKLKMFGDTEEKIYGQLYGLCFMSTGCSTCKETNGFLETGTSQQAQQQPDTDGGSCKSENVALDGKISSSPDAEMSLSEKTFPKGQ